MIDAAHEDAILRNDVYYLEPLRAVEQRPHRPARRRGARDHARASGRAPRRRSRTRSCWPTGWRAGADLTSALREYESIRRPRAKRVLKLSRRADRAAQLANPLGWRLRNALARRTPARSSGGNSSRSIRHKL